MKPLRVLVACEESQTVTKAFRAAGHEAFSCDIQSCSGGYPEWHIQDDVLNHLADGWDLMIGHPPCTYISYAGTGHWNKPGRLKKRMNALIFFMALWEAPITFIALENPKSCASPVIKKYDQEIQPYYFGDNAIKTTWLWLKNLPLLHPTNLLPKPKPIYIDQKGKQRHFTDAISGGGYWRKTTIQNIPGYRRRNGRTMEQLHIIHKRTSITYEPDHTTRRTPGYRHRAVQAIEDLEEQTNDLGKATGTAIYVPGNVRDTRGVS